MCLYVFFFFSSRRRHTRCGRDWSSDVCSSDLARRVYGSGSASRGRRGAGAPGVLRLLRGYAFAIAGIAIGVAGVVALGAMSERIVRFIEGGDRFVLGQISVAGRGMGMGAGFTAGGLL